MAYPAHHLVSERNAGRTNVTMIVTLAEGLIANSKLQFRLMGKVESEGEVDVTHIYKTKQHRKTGKGRSPKSHPERERERERVTEGGREGETFWQSGV